MSYEVRVVEEFKRDVKKLFKKYRSIKLDILELIEKLEKDYTIGIDLGSNLYKIRVKNSDTLTNIINEAFKNGVLVLKAGKNTLRFLPPLTISKTEVDTGFLRLDEALKSLEI